jgi:hypothetical protein
MNLYKYENYEEYKQTQVDGNLKKINKINVVEFNLLKLIELFIKQLNPKFGLCHGTRRGLEQKIFNENLENCKVLGTEISPTATDFLNTIQWDFHEIKDEWINNVDFIYTNSWDHAYDPIKAINNWIKCLTVNGICILEYQPGHKCRICKLDPFKGTFEELTKFLQDNHFNINQIYELNEDYKYIILGK